MSKERWFYLAALAGVGVLFYRCDAAANREQGALAAQIRTLSETNRQLAARADSLNQSFRTETVTVREAVTRWRTVVDSIWRVDSIPVTHRETVLVARADTAIRACTDALGTCSALVRTKDTQLATLDSILRLERRKQPSFLDKARSAVVYLAAGYLLGVVTR